MKRGSSALLVAVLVLAVSPSALAQSAADKESARLAFEQGKTKRSKGDWAGALEAFKAADAIMRVPTTKLAIARASLALGKLVDARDAALAVALIPVEPREAKAFTDARRSAAELARELEPRVPTMTIELVGAPSTDETEVTVDGVAVPKIAIRTPRRVDPGKHVLVASLRGGEVTAEIDIAENDKRSVALDVTELAKRPLPGLVVEKVAPERPAEPPPKSGKSPLLWVGLGVAVIGAGVGATAGLLSMSHKSDVDAQCRDGKCPPAAYDALDEAKSWATISTVGFAAAGAGVVLAGIGLFIKTDASNKSARVAPLVTAGGAGLQGSF